MLSMIVLSIPGCCCCCCCCCCCMGTCSCGGPICGGCGGVICGDGGCGICICIWGCITCCCCIICCIIIGDALVCNTLGAELGTTCTHHLLALTSVSTL